MSRRRPLSHACGGAGFAPTRSPPDSALPPPLTPVPPPLGGLFDGYQFRSVLNCAGNCALRACELDSRLAWRTNVEGLVNLLSIIVERDVRLLRLSLVLVYSGARAGAAP